MVRGHFRGHFLGLVSGLAEPHLAGRFRERGCNLTGRIGLHAEPTRLAPLRGALRTRVLRRPVEAAGKTVGIHLSKQVDLDGQDGAREDAYEQLVHRADFILVFMLGPEEPEAPLFPLDTAAVR
eukprot:scaffold423_cov69-Phaeocystis_antarctica.AAC.1